MSCRMNEKECKLIKVANENGIFLREDCDTDFTCRITPERRISVKKGKLFTREHMNEIYRIADYGNMEYTKGNIKKHALIQC